MRLISTIFSLAFLIILVTFVTHNTSPVTLNFWPFNLELTMPASLMGLIFFALGCLFGAFLALPRLVRLSLQKSKLSRDVNKLKKEIKKNQTEQNAPQQRSSPAFLQRLMHKPKGTDDDQ